MGLVEIFLIAVGLSMDSFAVSICKGLSMKKMNWKSTIIIALYFGIFHTFIPVVGYFFGSAFESFVNNIDHWIAFVLLAIIGINMIKEAFNSEDDKKNDKIDFKTMIILAIATSIDALAVGITFAFFQANIILASLCIGITVFLISILGVKIGNKFGDKFQNKAKILGGIILILIGLKILLEHLNVL